MNPILAMVPLILVALSGPQSSPVGSWRGLVPLHSTRAEVERLLGPSGDNFYETASEKISIEYSQGRCKGFLSGWNVETDTILMITVRPNAEMRLTELAPDLTRFDKALGTDTPQVYYTNRDIGVRYAVRENGIVESISYIPKRGDYSLRCEGFPSTPDLGRTEFKPFDTYSNILLADERARLDNFSIWLHEQPQMKGYIMVYASMRIPSNRAKLRAKNARDYLVKVRRLSPKRIKTVYGGYREQFQIELYILPASATPPISQPTVAPSRANKKSH